MINNAAIFSEISFLDISVDDLEDNVAIHVKAPLILMQQYAKLIQKGHIINITDHMVTKEVTRFFPYILTKKSLSNLTKMAAKHLAPEIIVTEIAPGRMLEDLAGITKLDSAQELSIEEFFKEIDNSLIYKLGEHHKDKRP